MQNLKKQFRDLRLNQCLQTIDLRNEQALTTQMTYVEFLKVLLEDEITARETKRYENRLKSANLRGVKTLDSFDFSFNPMVDQKMIKELSTCAFIAKKEPVIIVGPSGTGKTHLAKSLGFSAIQKGFEVLMVKQCELSSLLNEARATHALFKKITKLSEIPLLIIDDFALKPLSSQEEEDIHELIDRRSEYASTLITSNLLPHEWIDAFSNKLLAVATVDRLQFKATLLKMEGRSYRSKRQSADEMNSQSLEKKEGKSSSKSLKK